ncbi:MAG: CDGSH iron-sulfur domain-containing protein [Sphingobacteriales bacterium]|nr:CDGSH iron-sulfur domain-containing protein [Sphingobacteriales bacterium]
MTDNPNNDPDKPIIQQKSPYCVTIEAQKKFSWCSCGRSQTDPRCDGTHKTTCNLRPITHFYEETTTVWFCGCKQTKHPLGYCDGSHKS